ncbi:hypothetical protein A3Q56_06214 [Intoshia linei]|uniref:Uncharacterized protein n=1 Tax=Intoshia linei TaxID=1819745 RepID=A0A177AVQ3_9BILA|nr:hypothetical protein A3Q56_06214 [Intoshia linei]
MISIYEKMLKLSQYIILVITLKLAVIYGVEFDFQDVGLKLHNKTIYSIAYGRIIMDTEEGIVLVQKNTFNEKFFETICKHKFDDIKLFIINAIKPISIISIKLRKTILVKHDTNQQVSIEKFMYLLSFGDKNFDKRSVNVFIAINDVNYFISLNGGKYWAEMFVTNIPNFRLDYYQINNIFSDTRNKQVKIYLTNVYQGVKLTLKHVPN